ncbi:MAG: TIGR03960 family B12-binding radical SAM protein [Bacillota bacterium]
MEVRDKIEDKLYQVEKPERYIGNEWNQVVKDWLPEKKKILLAFPDLYEIGMSHLGLKILYHLLNQERDIICERVYAPWPDLEELLDRNDLPLFSLESGREILDFDILGFTLQYEMSYTNIINMLDLGGIPLYSKDRTQQHPLIIAGGSTVYNPEPIAPFIDVIFIGEAEEGIINLVKTYFHYKEQNMSRKQILVALSELPGVYVPSLYNFSYGMNGEVNEFKVAQPGIKSHIDKQIVADLDQAFYPTNFIVPYMDIVHNRAVLELARGCTRGCRFCAAGIGYRPVRERKMETILQLTDEILKNTGYEEISLSSLSTVDYTEIEKLVKTLADKYKDRKISISLPSLRIDEFSIELAEEVQKVRKTGLTFAPEAGTDRLRKVINKGVKEKDLFQAAEAAFDSGWNRIKLYFMIGLPTETKKDLEGIVRLVHKVREIGRQKAGNRTKIEVGISTFIPKPYTPFQWVEMIDREQMEDKQAFLRSEIRGKGLNLSWDEPQMSLLEGIFARGDRRLAAVIETAWKKGARFDGWNEHFNFSVWEESLREHDLDPVSFLKKRSLKNDLPWSHIKLGVSEDYLKTEYKKGLNGEFTSDCRDGKCTRCGINSFYPGVDNYVN